MKKDTINSSEDNVVSKIYMQSLGAYILSDIAYKSGPLVDGIVTGNFLGVQAVAATCLLSPAILVFTFHERNTLERLTKHIHRITRRGKSGRG